MSVVRVILATLGICFLAEQITRLLTGFYGLDRPDSLLIGIFFLVIAGFAYLAAEWAD